GQPRHRRDRPLPGGHRGLHRRPRARRHHHVRMERRAAPRRPRPQRPLRPRVRRSAVSAGMSNLNTAIELRGVGKRFIKYEDTPMLLTSAMRLRPKTRRERLWAVRGVDMDITDGETFGVIGRNGSGKTTLMSMMAGVTAPSEGSVKVWGRVAPLIAVGVGFHREL